MVIFYSYVKLPEGTLPIFSYKKQYAINRRSCFLSRHTGVQGSLDPRCPRPDVSHVARSIGKLLKLLWALLCHGDLPMAGDACISWDVFFFIFVVPFGKVNSGSMGCERSSARTRWVPSDVCWFS